MVSDFNLPVALSILPTVREADGLAISSRNAYLSAEDRKVATVLYQALQTGRRAFDAKAGDGTAAVVRAMVETVTQESRAQLDYAEVRDPQSFVLLEALQAPALLVIAAKVGPTRLIDNFLLRADGSWETGVLASELKWVEEERDR
jgi:pantoate--beta-alanine ligase